MTWGKGAGRTLSPYSPQVTKREPGAGAEENGGTMFKKIIKAIKGIFPKIVILKKDEHVRKNPRRTKKVA